jgi:hypothetical protein
MMLEYRPSFASVISVIRSAALQLRGTGYSIHLPNVASNAMKSCHSRMHSALLTVRMRELGCLRQLRKSLFRSIISAFSHLSLLLLKDAIN